MCKTCPKLNFTNVFHNFLSFPLDIYALKVDVAYTLHWLNIEDFFYNPKIS